MAFAKPKNKPIRTKTPMDVAMVSSWCVYLKEDPIGPTACQDRCRIEFFIIINLTHPSTCTTFYYILLHF